MVKANLCEYWHAESKTSVIMSGADEKSFNENGLSKLNKEKIKFVTHHWSNHFNKGFDIYKEFDDMLSKKENENIEFTYIGNIPDNIHFKNIIVKEPLSGSVLASEIKKKIIFILQPQEMNLQEIIT